MKATCCTTFTKNKTLAQ